MGRDGTVRSSGGADPLNPGREDSVHPEPAGAVQLWAGTAERS